MNRLAFLAAVVAVFAVAAPASAQQDVASGAIEMTVHTHSSEYGGPGQAPLLAGDTDPLQHPISEQSFSYSSVSCADPAPFNDVALNFNPDYPGIEDPASVRHVVEGDVTDVSQSGKVGTVEGTLTTYLCENGEEGDRIDFSFDGKLVQTSDNDAQFRGRFTIEGGTGQFADMTGRGSMAGRLTCLPTILEREGAESCAELGEFSDAVFFRGEQTDPVPGDVTGGLKGSYTDPTA